MNALVLSSRGGEAVIMLLLLNPCRRNEKIAGSRQYNQLLRESRSIKIFWKDRRKICKSSTTHVVTASVIFKCRLSFHTQAKMKVILQPRDVPIWDERECNRTLRCVALLISLVVRNGNCRGLQMVYTAGGSRDMWQTHQCISNGTDGLYIHYIVTIKII